MGSEPKTVDSVRCRLCGYSREKHEKYCLWTTKSWEDTPKRYLDTENDH